MNLVDFNLEVYPSPSIDIDFHADDLLKGGAKNIQAFLDGVMIGLRNMNISVTDQQQRNWELDWGELYIAEQFLLGYQNKFNNVIDDWKNLATSAGNLFEQFFNNPVAVYNKVTKAIDLAFEMLTSPKYTQQMNKAGIILGQKSASWLEEVKYSPPKLANKCGELAALLVWEAIESLLTAGMSKGLKVADLARKIKLKLPKRISKKINQLETRGTFDKGLIKKKPNKLDEVSEDIHEMVEQGFGRTTSSKPYQPIQVSDNHRGTAQKGLQMQNKNENLPTAEKQKVVHIKAGKQQDLASTSVDLSRRFSKVLNIIDVSFKRHVRHALKELPAGLLKELAELKNLRDEMANLAEYTLQKNKAKHKARGTIPTDLYVIDNPELLNRANANYMKAREIANKYGKLREETWKRIFEDEDLQHKIIELGMENLPELKSKYPGKLTKAVIIKEIWPDNKQRNDVLWRAYKLIWNNGKEGKAPRSAIITGEGKSSTSALNLEHLIRRTDNPYQSFSSEFLTPTTNRVNISINEGIRKIERDNTVGFIRLDPTMDESIEDFVNANREVLRKKIE